MRHKQTVKKNLMYRVVDSAGLSAAFEQTTSRKARNGVFSRHSRDAF